MSASTPLRALIERGRALLLTGLIEVCLFPVTRGFAQEETDTAYFRNVSAKLILECFKQAREAVLLQDAVLCWPSGTGRAYLDRKTPQPETEDVEKCEGRARSGQTRAGPQSHQRCHKFGEKRRHRHARDS